MIRLLAAATLAVALLPASAEAAKFRSGSRSHNTHASQSQRDSSHVVVTPTLRARQTQSATNDQPLRIVTPAATATVETADLRGTTSGEPRIWCRSQVVVGGFCVMN